MLISSSTPLQKRTALPLAEYRNPPQDPQQLDLFTPDRQTPVAILSPFGRLYPGDRKAKQYQLPLQAERVQAPDFPTAGNEIHLSATSKMNFNALAHSGTSLFDQVKVLTQARLGNQSKAAAITVQPEKLSKVTTYLGPNSILRVQALVGQNSPTTEAKVAAVQQAISQGADEVAVVPDYRGLAQGDEQGLLEELRALKEAAGEVPLKVVFDGRRQSDQEISSLARLAEETGVTYLRTATGLPEYSGPLFGEHHREPIELAKLLKKVTPLNVEFASGLSSLSQVQKISSILDDRRLRFESMEAENLIQEEAELHKDQKNLHNTVLGEEMRGDEGTSSLFEREKLMQYFEDKIAAAHQAGKPVVYLSVPVRTNDAGDFESNLVRASELVATAEKAGVAYIDPFEVEGTPILTSKDISGRAVQELLMDPSNGLWPRVLGMCDAIAHAPNWKFSTGAREEQLMADVWGIPVWDGSEPLAIKQDKPEDPTFFLVE